MTNRKLIAPILALALLAAACGSDGSNAEDRQAADEGGLSTDDCPTSYTDVEVYPLFISSEIVVGENRFQVGLLDQNDAPVSAPDADISVDFVPLGEEGTESSAELTYIETVPSQDRGVYVTTATFDEPGPWMGRVSIEGGGYSEQADGCFEVSEEASTPAVGAEAPATDNPTADDVNNLKKISTDPDPNPRFYRSTVADALKAGEPFLLVFATPKFCSSQTCGPILETVERVVAPYKDLVVIHSEIYEDLEPTSPPVEAVVEWGLPSEPWVFAVDAEGKVAAKFEGSISEEELTPVLDEITAR